MPLRVAHVGAHGQALPRATTLAQILLVTPDTLHERLLRHHDRAWQPFWSRLRMLAIADIETYYGIAATHLAGLLMRCIRLARHEPPPLLAATLANVQDASTALQRISGETWRVLPVDDTPAPAGVLAIWQSDHQRLREAALIAQACMRESYHVHITCTPLEVPILRSLMGGDTNMISIGTIPMTTQVHLFTSYPANPVALRQSLISGTLLTLVLFGQQPIERTIARMPEIILQEQSLAWVIPSTNAYIAAQHILCAATERPLAAAEVVAWQAGEMIERLERHQQLLRFPDNDAAWQPTAAAGDPYAHFGLRSAGGPGLFCVTNGACFSLLSIHPALIAGDFPAHRCRLVWAAIA
ncbi:MAG: hypothetical protein HC837_15905 [Chloroflexaceae bacterium]|nr:hypothetical protein [Chloroflexaceae bacterium]